MALIKTRNTLHEEAPQTRLSDAESASATSLRVENNTAMTTSWAVQIGKTGDEQSEVKIGTPSGTGTITCAATSFAHPADTPVYFIKYDKVVFERSTAGTAGTAAPMTNGTINYQPDSLYTVFDDTSGSSTYGYRTYFRNSALAVNSTESDWITFAGHSFYSLGKMRERAKQRLWNADYLDDDTIDNLINEWKFEMVNEVIAVNEDYALGTARVGFGTDGLGTITTEDFSTPRRVWVSYNGFNDTYKSTTMNINDFDPNEQFADTNPHHAWVGDNVFLVKPSSAGSADITFYRFGTTMVNDTDELPYTMRPFTKSFVDYVEAVALMKDGKQNEYRDKMTEAVAGKNNFVSKIVPHDQSSTETIDIVEPLGGEY